MTIEVGQFVIVVLPTGESAYGTVQQIKELKTKQKMYEVLITRNEDGGKIKEPYKYWVLDGDVTSGRAILNNEIKNLQFRLSRLYELRDEMIKD